MKKIIISIMALMFAFLLVGCQSNSTTEEMEEINIGLLLVPNDAILAKELGLIDEKLGELGYIVNYPVFDSGTDTNKAFLAGRLEFGEMGNINGLSALGSNLDTEMVWIHETLGAIEGLAVRNDANISTPADLSGKTIATPFSSTAHYVLLNVIKEAGIEGEVTILDMPTNQIISSWKAGLIDGAYTWQPSLGEILSQDGTILVDSEDMVEKGYLTANVTLAKKSFADEHPEVVEAYLEALAEANEYYYSNTVDAVDKISTALGLEPSEVEFQISGSIWTSLADMQSETFITKYVDNMYDQTIFMLDQNLTSRVITKEEVAAFINNEYALRVTNE